MSIFDYINTTVKSKLKSDGFIVNDSMQDIEGYRQGPYLVFISAPIIPEIDETSATNCIKHKVQFTIDMYAYDYDGTSNVDNISEVYLGVAQSLFLLRTNKVQDLSLMNGNANIDFIDEVGNNMSVATLTYEYTYSQDIS